LRWLILKNRLDNVAVSIIFHYTGHMAHRHVSLNLYLQTKLPSSSNRKKLFVNVWTYGRMDIQTGFITRDNIYAIARICYRPSVCPSVRWVNHTKTVEVSIMTFSPYSSSIPLVFREQVSSRNSEGFP